jgi:hypothetical protein
MLSIYESLKPLCVLRRRGMGVSNTMQPLMDMGCMRGVLQGDWFRGTQQIYKKANGCRTLSRIERNFLRYRSFFPFTLMVVILALFLIRAYYISFLPYMSYTYISFYSNMWIYEDLNIYDLSYIWFFYMCSLWVITFVCEYTLKGPLFYPSFLGAWGSGGI